MHQDVRHQEGGGQDLPRAAARREVQRTRLRGVALLGLGIVIFWWVRIQIRG